MALHTETDDTPDFAQPRNSHCELLRQSFSTCQSKSNVHVHVHDPRASKTQQWIYILGHYILIHPVAQILFGDPKLVHIYLNFCSVNESHNSLVSLLIESHRQENCTESTHFIPEIASNWVTVAKCMLYSVQAAASTIDLMSISLLQVKTKLTKK